MLRPRHIRAHALSVLLFIGCSASHENEVVGATGEASCVVHWLAYAYGASVFAYQNGTDGPVDLVEIPISAPLSGDRISAVTTVDFDGDGLRDVVIRNAYGGAALLEERVSLTLIRGSEERFENRERRRFVGDFDVVAGGGVSALGDWNGDGLSDLGVEYDGGIILSGDPLTQLAERCALGVGVGDVDGDGSHDTLCRTEMGLEVRLGGAASPDVIEVPSDTPVGYPVPVGDLNGDGRPEVLIETSRTWEMVDLVAGTRSEMSDDIRSVRPVGDADGDGLDDFVARRGNAFHLWRGGADGPAEDEMPFSSAGDTERTVSAAGDVNCDGYTDVLVRDHHVASDSVSLHLGGPEGVASEPRWRADVARGSLVPVFD